MSPESARTAAVGLLCLFVGGGLGAYGAQRLTGPQPSALKIDPGVKTACPKCEVCPACPAAPDCGELGVVPPRDQPADLPILDDPLDEPLDERLPDPNALPGLPPTALKLATGAVTESVGACLSQAAEDGERGTLVLGLTITATGGAGFISDAKTTTHDGDLTGALECAPAAALRARFEWPGADGRQDLKLPLAVGE